MELVDQDSHRNQYEEADHRVDAHDLAELIDRHAQRLLGEEQIEHRPADGRGVVAGDRQKEPAVEGEAETLPEVGADHVAFARLRRRILPLFHEDAHQKKRN